MQIKLKPEQNYTVSGILPSADSWYIAHNYNSEGVWLIVCENAVDIERIFKELNFLAPHLKVHIFADRELLPYDQFSAHSDLISQRLATLYALNQNQCNIVLSSADTVAQKIAPINFLAKYTFNLQINQEFDEVSFKHQMNIAGYTHVNSVMQCGEFCIRGGIIDVFPMGVSLPYRIDLFGSTIESIKVFNVDSQRSLYDVNSINLLPSKEYSFDKQAQQIFLTQFKEKFNNTNSIVYKNIQQGIAISGIESYLPLFFEQESTSSLFDYLPKNSRIITIGDISKNLQALWKDAEQHYNFFATDIQRPLLPPQDLYLKENEWFGLAKKFGRLSISSKQQDNENNKKSESICNPLPDIFIQQKKTDILANFKNFINQHQNYVIIVCAESLGRLDTLQSIFNQNQIKFNLLSDNQATKESDLKLGLYLQYNPIHFGFILPSKNIIYVSEQNLFANYIRKQNKQKSSTADIENIVKDLAELNIDDAVVHINHGIGRYKGLISIDTGQGLEDFFHIEYAKEANLYVPVQHLHLISRYAGNSPENAPLNQLGSGQWEKAKRKAAEKIHDTAAELLELYAKRSLRNGYSVKLDEVEYAKFADNFGFTTTEDQEQAIQSVLKDLCNEKSMDRLVCGDVGFGKTEVAMRAAFVVAMSGKQVLILSPTTLLAEQHYQNFTNRFSPWAINIAEFSRFKTPKQIKENIKNLNEGKVDIAIGTHKLLSSDIQPPNLGLIIIDEEHRFGVRQKELIKNMRVDIDILSLTATPIPRTLGMALEGLREFSVIATAPQKRLSVKTFVREENKSLLREAVLREIKRGGQVYFVHNDVATIEYRKQQIQEIIEEANIAIAHGQMPERELEQVMKDFHHQKFNVLLCTTIIETGIDIPTANTIIVDKADNFGLAQLHQLRGRVGRSHHQAYAYLLVNNFESLNISAQRRLDAIQNLQELGSGFYLAMQDLEIRGAGEILGDKQSGEMQQIGFNLYTEMLNQAVKSLKEGKIIDLMEPLQTTIGISLGSPALIPDSYIFDVHLRLSTYKKLSVCKTFEEIHEIQESIIDQFGKLPLATKLLIINHRLRILGEKLGIHKIICNKTEASISFNPNNSINPEKIIKLLQTRKDLALAGEHRIKITYSENLCVDNKCLIVEDFLSLL